MNALFGPQCVTSLVNTGKTNNYYVIFKEAALRALLIECLVTILFRNIKTPRNSKRYEGEIRKLC